MRPYLPHAAARAFVFDNWVFQGDRVNTDNIVFGWDWRDRDRRGFSFLDFAYALAYGRSMPILNTIEVVPYPEDFLASIDRVMVERVLGIVERYPRDRLCEVIDRVPEDFLSPQERATIRATLQRRQETLRSTLKPFLPGDH